MKKLLIISSLLISLTQMSHADSLTVGFSGGDGSTTTALSVVLSAINSAKQSINVSAYSFTSKPITQALIMAQGRGVSVKIVADANQNNKSYSGIYDTASAGIPTKVNSNYQDFHNKFMIVDNKCVETGSFNYSASAANKNAENALLICDSNLAKVYTKEFNYWFSQGTFVNDK